MAERRRFPSWLGTGLLLGALGASGCDGSSSEGSTRDNNDDVMRGGHSTGLVRARDCDDLLAKIQEDAILKVKMAVTAAKERDFGHGTPTPGGIPVFADAGVAGPIAEPAPNAPTDDGTSGEGSGGSGDSGGDGDGNTGGDPGGPTGASDTNNQVAGVDEADFIKVVDNGRAMFVLHGNTLRKLTSWPAAETALESASLVIEGSPTEMFVTDEGKAVIFSNVWGYASGGGKYDPYAGDIACAPGGYCGYGYNSTKITLADVSGDQFKAERELYYEGQYVSSRRYEADDMVRVVLQAAKDFSALSTPRIQWYDFEGKPYPKEELELQLDQWAERTERDIRKRQLSYWLPVVYEAQGDALAEVPPACDNYFVPQAGTSDYGLTHVLSVDASDPEAPVGGVTVLGGAQTVYSNREHMVLAQPDYRWMGNVDFGFVDEQRTALHMFGVSGADTNYVASGWVPGHLPSFNPQFGIDVREGVVRVATTGFVRKNPDSTPDQQDFWLRIPQNHVFTLQAKAAALSVTGKSAHFGHEGETVQSARFLGNRAYVVTFRQTDPLVVLDVSDPKQLKILGEIEIPGFSQYMHPLDETHLITLGQNGSWGVQLQLFDVSDPMNLPQPKVLDFGDASSEGQYNHKAFTFYAEENLLALPLHSYSGPNGFGSGLRIVHVDKASGFTDLGTVDHTALYQQQEQGCVQCYDWGCEYYCSYQPEVRRGHFVSSKEATYVYSFSHAGVLVNDVDDLANTLATVTLPAPVWNEQPWHAPTAPGTDDGSVGPTPGAPPVAQPDEPRDAGSPIAVDAGSSEIVVDGGSSEIEADAGMGIEG